MIRRVSVGAARMIVITIATYCVVSIVIGLVGQHALNAPTLPRHGWVWIALVLGAFLASASRESRA